MAGTDATKELSSGQVKISHFIRSVLPMKTDLADAIALRFSEKQLGKNDFLLQEGHVCNVYSFLEKGFLRSYTYDTQANDVTTGFYTEGQVVCELLSFFRRVPSAENIQALQDCTIHCLTFDELQEVFHAMPEFREFGRMVLVNHYALLKRRMLAMIRETAEERYAALVHTSPDIVQHAPLRHIASYIGITETSLSRIRKVKRG